MMIHTAHTFRIYPSEAPAILINKTIGCSRWNKQRVKVANMYEYITNARKDYVDNISTAII